MQISPSQREQHHVSWSDWWKAGSGFILPDMTFRFSHWHVWLSQITQSWLTFPSTQSTAMPCLQVAKTACLDHELARWFKVLYTHTHTPHPHLKTPQGQTADNRLISIMFLFILHTFIYSSLIFLQWPCSYTITQRERERIMEPLTFCSPPNLWERYGR